MVRSCNWEVIHLSTYSDEYPPMRRCIKREFFNKVNSGHGTFVCGSYAKGFFARESKVDMVCRIIEEFHICRPFIMKHFKKACFGNRHTMKTLVFHQLLEDANTIIFLIDDKKTSGGHLLELGIVETLGQIYDGNLNIIDNQKTAFYPEFDIRKRCWILLKAGVKKKLSPMLYGGVIEFFEHNNRVLEHDGSYQSLRQCIKEIEIRSTG